MRRTLSAFLLLLSLTTAGAASPSLSVTADRDELYLGESFQVTLRIEDADQETEPAEFDASAAATYDFLGSSSDSRMFVQMVNGRTTRRQTIARVLTYRVTPKESGTFQIRRVAVRMNATALTAPGPSVRVTGAAPQEHLRIELAPSRDAVLVDEPFEIVLSVTVRPLAGANRHHDPFPVSPPPKLDIPHLAVPVPKGLKGPEANELLQPLLVNQRNAFGFAINDLTIRNDPFANPFGMSFDAFGQPTTARFRLERDEVRRDGETAWRYRLTMRYTPEHEGSHTFGPVAFKGQVITGVQAGGAPVLRSVFAVAPAVTVRVVPPPEEGRPDSFVGTVGVGLAAQASLDTQTCRQGDPLTLALELTGAVSLSNLRAPQLSRQPAVTNAFRVYDDAVRTEPLPKGRRFLYTIRPLQAGTIEVPALAASYYDTAERAYRTVHTDPIPLRVEAVEQFDPGSIIDTAPEATGRSASIRVRPAATIPAAITANPEGTVSDPPLPGSWHALLLLPGPLLAGLAAALRWGFRHRREWRSTRRRRNAARRAARRIRRARTCPALLRATAGFFEDRFDVPATGFAPLDAAEALRTARVPEETARTLLSLLQQLFDESFQPDDPDPELRNRGRAELPALLRRCATETTLEP